MHLTISAGWYFCKVLIAGERRCQLILPTASEVTSYSIFYACRGLRGELSSLWRPSTCPESRGHVAIRTPNKNKWYWYLISFYISALQSITINNRCLWWCGFLAIMSDTVLLFDLWSAFTPGRNSVNSVMVSRRKRLDSYHHVLFLLHRFEWMQFLECLLYMYIYNIYYL